MEAVLLDLPGLLMQVWWPFCRALGLLSAAPFVGETMVPISARVLLALVLALVMLPFATPAPGIEPLSLHAALVTAEQALIGFGIGMAFHLVTAALMMLGYLVSSQMGLAMALMNDPVNGTSSDVVSVLLYVLGALVFFAIDGHIVLAQILGASFRNWPVGGGLGLGTFEAIAYAVGWALAAALLLALPVVFSALVVQLGFGFLNRIAPTLSLYSLGFSAIIVFGLFVLGWLVRHVPEHYVNMTGRVLELLRPVTR